MECSTQSLALYHLAVEISPEDACLLRETYLGKHSFTETAQAGYKTDCCSVGAYETSGALLWAGGSSIGISPESTFVQWFH